MRTWPPSAPGPGWAAPEAGWSCLSRECVPEALSILLALCERSRGREGVWECSRGPDGCAEPWGQGVTLGDSWWPHASGSSCHHSWGRQGPTATPGLVWFVFHCGMPLFCFSSKTLNLWWVQTSGRSLQTREPGGICPSSTCLPVLQHQPSLGVLLLVPKNCHVPGRGCHGPISAVWLFYLFPFEADSSVPGCKENH